MLYFPNLNEIVKQELMEISRNTATFIREVEDGRKFITKTYRPSRYPEYSSLKKNKPTIVMEGGYQKGSNFYFLKETRILETLLQQFPEPSNNGFTSISSLLTPTIYEHDTRQLDIHMEFLDNPTFKEVLLKCNDNERKKNYYREKLLQHVAYFQERVNNDLYQEGILNTEIKLGKSSRKIITLRTKQEEVNRLSHYIRLMVFHHSKEFQKKHSDGKTYSNKQWKRTKKRINYFLERKGIDFKDFIGKTLQLHDQIIYDGRDPYNNQSDLISLLEEKKLQIVHGDFGPQNVFYQQNGLGKLIDFDEMRIATPHVDLVHALYHASSNPSEEKVLTLLRKHIEDLGQQGIKYDWDDFLAGFIEARYMENIRKIASDSRMSQVELQKFAGLVVEDKDNIEELRGYNLNKNTEFCDFYLRGGGLDAIQGEKKELLRAQLTNFEFFYRGMSKKPNRYVQKSSSIRKQLRNKNKNKKRRRKRKK